MLAVSNFCVFVGFFVVSRVHWWFANVVVRGECFYFFLRYPAWCRFGGGLLIDCFVGWCIDFLWYPCSLIFWFLVVHVFVRGVRSVVRFYSVSGLTLVLFGQFVYGAIAGFRVRSVVCVRFCVNGVTPF